MHRVEKKSQQNFSRLVSGYSKSSIFSDERALKEIERSLAPTKRARILDVGCGFGAVSLWLAKRAGAVIGVDLTPAMLREARRRAAEARVTNVSFKHARASSLPFPANTFDAVVCRYAFHHFPDFNRALSEMRRVCKPGGTLLIIDGMAPEDKKLAALLQQVEMLKDDSHNRYLPKSEFIAKAERHGFRALSLTVKNLPIDMHQWFERSKVAAKNRKEIERIFAANPGLRKLMNFRKMRGGHHFEYSILWLLLRKPCSPPSACAA